MVSSEVLSSRRWCRRGGSSCRNRSASLSRRRISSSGGCRGLSAQAPKSEWAKTPVKSGGFAHLVDEPAFIYIHDSYVSASGVWVDKEHKNPPAGPSVSDITCVRAERTCEESQAMMVDFGDSTFTLTADHAEYQIDRWNEEEIVATCANKT